jgi:hypothetical protein
MSLITVNVHTLGLPSQELRTKERQKVLTSWFDHECILMMEGGRGSDKMEEEQREAQRYGPSVNVGTCM